MNGGRVVVGAVVVDVVGAVVVDVVAVGVVDVDVVVGAVSVGVVDDDVDTISAGGGDDDVDAFSVGVVDDDTVVDVLVDGVAIVGSDGAGMLVDGEFVALVEDSGGVASTAGFEMVTALGVDGSAPPEFDVCCAIDGTVVVAHGGPVATAGPATGSAIPAATTATTSVGRRLRRPIRSKTAPASTTAAAMTRSDCASTPVAGNWHSLNIVLVFLVSLLPRQFGWGTMRM